MGLEIGSVVRTLAVLTEDPIWFSALTGQLMAVYNCRFPWLPQGPGTQWVGHRQTCWENTHIHEIAVMFWVSFALETEPGPRSRWADVVAVGYFLT